MPSTYNGLPLFESGPHRFVMYARGQAEIPPGRSATLQSPPLAKWQPLGLMPQSIHVVGRLVAETEAQLWALRDALTAALTATPSGGTLEDGGGQSWPGMWLVRYEEKGPADAGRVWSIGYEAIFRKVP